ncbi:hypothetical protein ACKF11_13190 [Methylobacillus sp. Pita2]|uniref:ADP-ribosyltransferase-containing protein n=1 Tax=Methylobacillus sp. Pita2 TaxID=3383245 RepID=UPI0038B5A57A
MIAYHGTDHDFDSFEKPVINQMADRAAIGFWFTSSKDDARQYGSTVLTCELNFTKPYRTTRRELDFMAVSMPASAIVDQIRAQGFDSILVEAIKPDRALEEPGQPEQYVMFDPLTTPDALPIVIMNREICTPTRRKP